MTKEIVKFVEDSENQKISPKNHKVCATYVSIEASCPNTCQLKNNGCYGQTSYVGIINKKLNESYKKVSTGKKSNKICVATIEKKSIYNSFAGKNVPQDGAKGGRDMRLHVIGDFKGNKTAKQLAIASNNWKKRNGGQIWSYTHNWKKIKRSSFGKNISILASIDNISDAKSAVKQGYVPAVVVDSFPNKNKAFEQNGIKWIPCLAQVTNLKCTECRLCLNADSLYDKSMGIAFEAHGAKKNVIKKRLKVL